MKRLTRKSQISDMVWFIDHENSNIDLEPCEMNPHHNRLAIHKLAEYEDLEEQCIKENAIGIKLLIEKWKEFLEDMHELLEYRKLKAKGRLLILPCAVGDVLYDISEYVEGFSSPLIYKIHAKSIEILKDEKGIIYCIDSNDYRETDFEKIVFSTKAEAEAALEKMKGEEHE